MTDQLTVEGHYGRESLVAQVERALLKAGLGASGGTESGAGKLSWTALEALDQFHLCGLAATKDMAERLHLNAETHVLDVGSGLGGPARYLAAVRGSKVTGIDLSQPFVDVANLLALRTGLADRVTYRQADALNLPFEAASFDHVWTQHVAMNIADRAGLYRGIHRVLKPGGSLAIYDIIAGDGQPPHYPLPWARSPEISFLLTEQETRDVLATAGFTEVVWEDKTKEALDWLAQQRAATSATTAPAGQVALGLPVVMGPDFPAMVANLGRNMAEGRLRLVQTIQRQAPHRPT
jgi:SAM-dependent methyltransferase